MIKNILILFSIFFLFLAQNSYSGSWKEIDRHVVEKGDAIYGLPFEAIDCFDNKNCIAVGNLGLSMPVDRHTYDGGYTWSTTLIDTVKNHYNPDSTIDWTYHPPRIQEVEYVSSDLCIAIADTGYYYRSTDSLKTWEKGQLEGVELRCENIEFYDDEFGGIVTTYKLFLTTNGGKDWFNPDFNLSKQKMPNVLVDISIPNPNKIVCLASNNIGDNYFEYTIISNDSGKTWNMNSKFSTRLRKINFIDSLNGWACGGNQEYEYSSTFYSTILHTTDGGKNWNIQLDTILYPEKRILQIYFKDKKHGIALNGWNLIWRTSDGGKNWEIDRSALDQKINILNDIAMLEGNKLIGVSDDISIYKYTEGTNIAFNNDVSKNKIKVYPNPVESSGEINIEIISKLYSKVRLELYNSVGKKISETYNFKQDSRIKEIKYSIDDNLSAGVYFLHIKIERDNIVKKFIITD